MAIADTKRTKFRVGPQAAPTVCCAAPLFAMLTKMVISAKVRPGTVKSAQRNMGKQDLVSQIICVHRHPLSNQ